MKKKRIVFFSLAITLSMIPNPVFAKEKVSITSPYYAQEQITLDETDAPILFLETLPLEQEEYRFGLELSGAYWSDTYENHGILPNTNEGVTYRKVRPSYILFEVNTKKFDTSQSVLEIPLFSTLKRSGEITVSLDRLNSPFNIAPLTYAYLGDPNFRIDIDTIKNIRMAQSIGDITIQDDYFKSVSGGTTYTLELTNGFFFRSKPHLKLEGKYDDDVTFEIDEKDASKAHLVVTKNTNLDYGKIVLQRTEIGPSNSSQYGEVELKFTGNHINQTLVVGEYVLPSNYDMPILIQDFEGGAKPSASGTAAPEKTLQIRIDDDDYGEIKVDMKGNWVYTFPYPFSNLQPGEHTFEVGYYQSSGDKWFRPDKTIFEILSEKATKTVSFPIGADYYTYDGRKGYFTAPTFIDPQGRTMLPLRAVSNILGIDHENIIWNPEKQSILISGTDRTIYCQIGSKEIIVDGMPQKIDTKPIIKNGTTFLPLRGILHAFGISEDDITWDDNSKTVSFELD